MLNALITGLFSLIAKLGDLILTPLVAAISLLIPNFSTFYNYIVVYIGYGFNYIGWVYKALCIPKACMTLVYSVALASFAITVGVRVYALIVKIYNTFKI